jgi:hypothetical protein
VLGDETFQEGPIIGVDGSLAPQDFRNRSALIARPGVKGATTDQNNKVYDIDDSDRECGVLVEKTP